MKLEALSRGLSHGSFGCHYLRNFDWSRLTLHISVSFLQDLLTRVQYLQDFIAFSSSNAAALHYLRGVVTPLVPAVLDAVYEKLPSFGITAKSFVPRQTGYTGIAPGSIEELTNQIPYCRIFGQARVDRLRKVEELGVSG